MTGDEVRQVFEAILPQEEIDRLCEPCGVIERQRRAVRASPCRPCDPSSL
jgi:hypothetical protein